MKIKTTATALLLLAVSPFTNADDAWVIDSQAEWQNSAAAISKLEMKDAIQIPLMLLNIWYAYNVTTQFSTATPQFQLALNEDFEVFTGDLNWNGRMAA